MTPQPTKSCTPATALSPPSGSAPTRSEVISSGESAHRNGTQSPAAPGTHRVSREKSRDTLAALVLGMALASPGKFKDSLAAMDSTAWTQRGQALVAALLAGDAGKAAAALLDYGVHRETGEAVTAAILRRLGEIAKELKVEAFQRRVKDFGLLSKGMATIAEPMVFVEWLKAELGKLEATPPG